VSVDKGPGRPAEQPVASKNSNWGTKIVLILVTIVLIALAALLAINFLPNWWAHRVGEVADGKFTSGIFAGLTCGVVFTAIPLLMLRRVFGRHGGVAGRTIWLILAALFAAPNLTTLAIVIGNGNAAHAAERTFDVEAPGFRNGSAIGAAAGAVLVMMFWLMMAGRRRRKKQLHQRDVELEHLRLEVQRRQADEDAPAQQSKGYEPRKDAEPTDR
jgi:membrane protein implicated in regulation of membrane protease activity